MHSEKFIRPGLILLLAIFTATAQAQQPWTTDTGKMVYEALSGDIRTDEERERDSNRKPVQTLEYFRLRDNWTVVELFPGGGWYTKILAPVLAEKGKLYLALGTEGIAGRLDNMDLDKVGITGGSSQSRRTDMPGYVYDLGDVDLGVSDVDLVLTFRNLHNMNHDSRMNVNRAVFDALKPGGIYGIVDHTRRHMEPTTPENWRRMDPLMMVKEVLDAGFELIGYSRLHYRPDDELEYDTTRATVRQNSDRFTIKFLKPRG
jgi:predicted methyltransferase